MNSYFLLSLTLGLGISGLALTLFRGPSLTLSARVGSGKNGLTSPVLLTPPAIGKTSISKRIAISARKQDQAKIDRALYELPDLIELIAVCLEAGDSNYTAICRVLERSGGEVTTELNKILRKINFGGSLAVEIKLLPDRIPHPQISELASKVALSATRGTPLAQMLHDQSKSLRSEIRNRLLKQVGKNETRMLIPLVFLILPVTVLFAIYPSLKLLNFNYF